jgi:hypothetical protein
VGSCCLLLHQGISCCLWSACVRLCHRDSPAALLQSADHPAALLLPSHSCRQHLPLTSALLPLPPPRAALLKQEEEWIKRTCEQLVAHKPDVVITEKGLSDLAAHYLTKAGISAIRRLRKTDNNRIARASGATIVHRCVCGWGWRAAVCRVVCAVCWTYLVRRVQTGCLKVRAGSCCGLYNV